MMTPTEYRAHLDRIVEHAAYMRRVADGLPDGDGLKPSLTAHADALGNQAAALRQLAERVTGPDSVTPWWRNE